MKTIRYVENGKIDDHGRPCREPVEVKSAYGLTLENAAGDISDQSTGFKYAIDTMSFIKAEITDQKFYTIPFADYMPVSVGRGSWADTIFTNVSFSNAGDFASGFIDTGLNTRFAGVDAAVAQKSQKVRTWAKQLTYSIAEVQQALQANNWDPIRAREMARKENYDLGVQEIAFKGVANDTDITGLLNNSGVTIDTTTIPKLISSNSAAEIAVTVQKLIASFFIGVTPFTTDQGAAYTAMPTHFAVPYADWLGLSVPFPGTAGTYPLPMIDYLLDAFKRQTMNPNFVIYPVAYCDPAKSASGATEYALYRSDPRSLCMELPIGYTTTAVNTINGFTFQNIGYSRIGGVGVFRNLEVRYFHF